MAPVRLQSAWWHHDGSDAADIARELRTEQPASDATSRHHLSAALPAAGYLLLVTIRWACGSHGGEQHQPEGAGHDNVIPRSAAPVFGLPSFGPAWDKYVLYWRVN